ncbi:DegT/DnrJ/EryC1/StrS family aminotransferase [Patescibacteria group bacterium]|nr:DegT/DnrJ/EryC1/StrS family aminotransferase [Patescibacteria group bacterium]
MAIKSSDKQAYIEKLGQKSDKWPYHPLWFEDDIDAVVGVLRSGIGSGYRGTPEGHGGGPKVQALQEHFKERFGVKHAIAFNSATSALHAACIAVGVHMGDEVIVSPYTFSSSASCVLMANGIPVFADVDPDIFNITAHTIEQAITPRTKAIIPVHLAGHSCDMYPILVLAQKHGLKVIEDSAQTLGGTYYDKQCGTMGDCGVFSFNQSKPVSTGEGGMLITNDDYIAKVARAVMNHGEVSQPELGVIGYNYRMTEMVAALALEQMKRLDAMNQIRIGLNNDLADFLRTLPGFTPPKVEDWAKHVYYTTMVKMQSEVVGVEREVFQRTMMQNGIYFGSGYVTPLYLYPIYQQRIPDVYRLYGKEVSYRRGLCPVAENLWSKELMVTDLLRFPATQKDLNRMKKVILKTLEDCHAR